MVNKSRTRLRQISVTEDDDDIIKRKLNHFGDLTGFVRYCLHKKGLIEEYLDRYDYQ